jgi:hypothetical protein
LKDDERKKIVYTRELLLVARTAESGTVPLPDKWTHPLQGTVLLPQGTNTVPLFKKQGARLPLEPRTVEKKGTVPQPKATCTVRLPEEGIVSMSRDLHLGTLPLPEPRSIVCLAAAEKCNTELRYDFLQGTVPLPRGSAGLLHIFGHDTHLDDTIASNSNFFSTKHFAAAKSTA